MCSLPPLEPHTSLIFEVCVRSVFAKCSARLFGVRSQEPFVSQNKYWKRRFSTVPTTYQLPTTIYHPIHILCRCLSRRPLFSLYFLLCATWIVNGSEIRKVSYRLFFEFGMFVLKRKYQIIILNNEMKRIQLWCKDVERWCTYCSLLWMGMKKKGICIFEYDNENDPVEHREHLRLPFAFQPNRFPTIHWTLNNPYGRCLWWWWRTLIPALF